VAVLLPVGSALAQQPTDSIRTEALRDFHGPDETGKDGPLARASLDLLVLYHEYQAFQAQGGGTFSPGVAGVRVSDGHVSIDAIAANEAGRLRADLKDLSLKNGAVAGRVVSGRLPIDQIPAMAKLESLRGAVLSRAETQGTTSPSSPKQTDPKPSPPQKSLEAIGDDPGTESTGGGGLGFLLILLGALLITELY